MSNKEMESLDRGQNQHPTRSGDSEGADDNKLDHHQDPVRKEMENTDINTRILL